MPSAASSTAPLLQTLSRPLPTLVIALPTTRVVCCNCWKVQSSWWGRGSALADRHVPVSCSVVHRAAGAALLLCAV